MSLSVCMHGWFMWMCVYLYVYAYTYRCVYVCIYISTHPSTLQTFPHIHLPVHLPVNLSTYPFPNQPTSPEWKSRLGVEMRKRPTSGLVSQSLSPRSTGDGTPFLSWIYNVLVMERKWQREVACGEGRLLGECGPQSRDKERGEERRWD